MSTERQTRSQSYAKVLLSNKIPAYIRDISATGFRVYSPVPLPYTENSPIRCTILPEGEGQKAIEISGNIRWNRQGKLGEELIGILITEFLSEQGSEYYKKLLTTFEKSDTKTLH